MSWIALCIIVLFGTAVWPLGRWALKADGEPIVVGFWVSLAVAVACAVGAALTGDWRGAPAGVWVASGWRLGLDGGLSLLDHRYSKQGWHYDGDSFASEGGWRADRGFKGCANPELRCRV